MDQPDGSSMSSNDALFNKGNGRVIAQLQHFDLSLIPVLQAPHLQDIPELIVTHLFLQLNRQAF